MARLADFLAFPYAPMDIMSALKKHGNLNTTPSMVVLGQVSFAHVTSVPPTITDHSKMLEAQKWFNVQLQRGRLTPHVVCGVQHPPLDPTQLHVLKRSGISIMSIAYAMENHYGGGFAAPDVPLSAKGKLLLDHMAEARMILDLSHVGHRTARDALEYAERMQLPLRIVATHSGCYSVYGHLRNLPDDVLKGIAERGGLIGIPTVTWLLDEKDNSYLPIVTHLNHLIGLVGDGHVCIGSDGVYVSPSPILEMQHFSMMRSLLDSANIFNPRYPEEATGIHGVFRLFNLFQILHPHFSKKTREKVCGENLCAFFGR